MFAALHRVRKVQVLQVSLLAAVFVGGPQGVAICAATTRAVGEQEKPQSPAQPQKPAEAGDAPAGMRRYFKGLFEGGGETRTPGDPTGKFEELRDVPRGVYVRALALDIQAETAAPEASFRALEVGQDDQRISGEVRRVGRFRTTLSWDQIPKSFADGQSLFNVVSAGVLDVDATLRAQLENASIQALPGLVRSAVGAAPAVALRVRRDEAFVRQQFRPTDSWEMYVQLQRFSSGGFRPISAGTFIRTGDPAFQNDGVWEGLGVELPQAVEYRTTNVTAGTQVVGTRWMLGVEYAGSVFRNRVDALTWTNPFRITDAAGTPPRSPAETALIGAGFTANRNRFIQAQLDLAPDNDYNSVNLRARYNLPGATQIRGVVSVARWTQDDPFLPYTLNTALVPFAVTLAPGQSPLSVSSLPALSLDGAMRTIAQDYAVVNRQWRKIDFQLQYRSYDLDNQNPHLVFPGYASFGDSGWRTAADFYGLPIENLPQEFTRQNGVAALRWRVTPTLTWREDYEFEMWHRTNRDVARTNEHRLRSRWDWNPARFAAVSADYTYAKRRAPDYRSTPLEFSELRRYDQSDRTHNDGRVSLDLRYGDRSVFSLSARRVDDDHPDGFYGLLFNDLTLVDAQYSLTPWEWLSFYANYSRERNRFAFRGVATVIIGGITTLFPPENTWERTSRSTIDFFQVGFAGGTPGGRFDGDIAYVWSSARDRITTTNPLGPVRADSILSATAFDYPDTTTKIQEFNVSASYGLLPNLRLGFRYWYEPFDLDDFALNAVQPYVQGTITSGAPRLLFLDAKFTSYRANVGTVFVRYQF